MSREPEQLISSDLEQQLQMPTRELPLEQLTVAMVNAWADNAAIGIAACQGMTRFGSPLHAVLAKWAGGQAEGLAQTVAEHAKRIPLPKSTDLLIKEGMIAHDALFADYLSGLGEAGTRFASEIRERSRAELKKAVGNQERFEVGLWLVPLGLCTSELWYLWDSGQGEDRGKKAPAWTRLLGAVLWEGDSGEVLRRKRTPVMVLPFAQNTTRLRRAAWVDGRIIDEQGEVSPLVPVGPAQLDALAQRGLDALDTPTADRLFGWLLRMGFLLHAADPDKPANMYSKQIVGGYAAIAGEIGLHNNKAATEIKELLAALTRCSLAWDVPGEDSGSPLPLLHLRIQHHRRPGRPETFMLGLSPLWTPGLCHLLTGSNRILVPWIELPDLSFLHTKHRRPAVLLWRGVRLALRVQAAEITRGGVRLDWYALASEARLPEKQIPQLVDSWTSDDAPLQDTGAGRVTVRDLVVRNLLTEGADRQKSQQIRGRHAAEKRRQKTQM